jgi:hypothetical protein
MKMPRKNIKPSHRLVNVIKWDYRSRKCSFEMLTTEDTIETFLNNLKINNLEKLFIYLGNRNKPFKLFKLKGSNLNIKIVDLFFSNTSFKNKDLFLQEHKFTDYSIHIFNYDHINSITTDDKSSIWEQLKKKFKGLDKKIFWTQIM